MKLTLAFVGALALVLFAGTGVVGWFATQEHVTIVLAEGEQERGQEVDPWDAVSTNVDALGEDLRALTEVLQRNFALLDENGAARAGDADAALREGLDGLTARLAALEEGETARRSDLAGMQTRIEELVAVVGSAPSSAAAAAPSPAEAGEGDIAPAAPAAEQPVVAAVTEPPPPEPVDEEEPAPAPRRSSFLAFDLPSDDFRFAERRAWTIVSNISRVGFDGTSTLHDFTGKTSSVTGELELDLAHPNVAPKGSIRVESATLRSGSEGRDEGMLEHLAVEEYPTLSFALASFTVGEVDPAARKVSGTAHGKMTIHGVSREVAMPIRAEIDDSRRLFFTGEMPLSLPDYGVAVPNKLGLVKMDPDVRVWIALRAKLDPREGR